ncbi:hypothetical protein B0A79_14305 [Flavobacterium piscis]|jgi:hypothetical protein|uniref:Lipocalin-like domain-containing protein n=1 Tax=Flavobacterium piscis TaxID=1114874 RepID=A0ABX2XG05_9FLAO|nr:hypothetical protein [Flavobacterium piscis]OCB70811.1 hypothetical protein FLP_19320 [Flavobacterium piscis]OXG03556.1 hypothetical protein B0A79_14305 [Flavobacterium piscis]
MKKQFLLFIVVCCLFSTAYSLESTTLNSGSIVNTWIWQKSIGGGSNPYLATPKTIGFTKKVVFTPEGRVITYKNNIEIRNSAYQMEKGSSFFDQSENDLITFEGKTYIIESLDNQNLTIVSNNQDATRTIFKR